MGYRHRVFKHASLLGEHRELHGIYSIITNDKKGYARHPETLRWKGFLDGLAVRHGMLVAEMTLRGFNHHSPIAGGGRGETWPPTFLDEPEGQYGILKVKYRDKPPGRIPLPGTIHALWASHKYSIMARDYNLYRKFGPLVAHNGITFPELSLELTALLRSAPPVTSLGNALLHMWGHVSKFSETKQPDSSPGALLCEIQQLSFRHTLSYMIQSTALGELAFWIEVQDC